MPSYRFTATVGLTRPGTNPATLLPAIAEATRALAVVEDSSLAVIAGAPRITIRFTGDSDQDARRVGTGILEIAAELAELSRLGLTRRVKQNWVPVPSESAPLD